MRKLGQAQDKTLVALGRKNKKVAKISAEILRRKYAYIEGVLDSALKASRSDLSMPMKTATVRAVADELPVRLLCSDKISDKVATQLISGMLQDFLGRAEKKAAAQNKTYFLSRKKRASATTEGTVTGTEISPNPVADIDENTLDKVVEVLKRTEDSEVKEIEKKLEQKSKEIDEMAEEEPDYNASGKEVEEMTPEEIEEETRKNNYLASTYMLKYNKKIAEMVETTEEEEEEEENEVEKLAKEVEAALSGEKIEDEEEEEEEEEKEEDKDKTSSMKDLFDKIRQSNKHLTD